MNDFENDSGTRYETGYETGFDRDFDPDIAEQFELLKRAEQRLDHVGSASAGPRPRDLEKSRARFGRRSLAGLTAAAAIGVVGISAVVLNNGPAQQIDAAATGNNTTVTIDNAASAEEINDSIAVVPDEDAVTELSKLGETTTTETSTTLDDSQSQTESSSAASESTTTAAEPTTTEPEPTTTEPPTTSRAEETTTSAPEATDGEQDTTTVTTAVDTTTTTEAGWTTTEGDGDVFTIRGIVSEIMTDCVGKVSLDPNGEIVSGGPVLCDAGSHIVVDGQRIQTSSGFVSADLAFDKHNRNLRPGQRVTVVATRSPLSKSLITLNCDRCGIRPG